MLGERVAGYRIEAVAGRGGMGIVFRACQLALDRPVALKLIAPELARDHTFRARFVRESRLTASLDHPNVIPVYEAGEDGERLFIAMRFVDGTDLGRLIAEHGALDPHRAAALVAQAGAALDAAHARGLVHRDVKPANLLIAGEPPQEHVYLTDFGLARSNEAGSALTTSGHWIGTPDYAAPEQIDGAELDPRADVYALGCVLFAALTGRPPFADRARMAKAAAHLAQRPPALRDVRRGVPAAFEPVVARALAKDPGERYGSAGELGEAALAAAEGETARTRVIRRSRVATPRLSKPRRFRPVYLAVAAVLVLVAAAVLVLALPDADRGAPAAEPAPPAAPPLADPGAGTVRCSGSSCVQDREEVQAPIEGSPCTVGTYRGEWRRVDAGSTTPLFACAPAEDAPEGSAPAAPVPDLAGARLDLAEALLDRLGIEHDTSGGGTFGILDRSAWTVCASEPAAGATTAPGDVVTLLVDREC
jgi:serine/threonine-protein kinase